MPHLPALIQDLAVILGVAALVTFLCNRIRQPVTLGYLIAGAVVGPHTPPFRLVTDLPNIQTWADLGVILLMFALGLDFSFRKLAKQGAPVVFNAIFEMGLMFGVGIITGSVLGWTAVDKIFLGCAMAISSSTIIYKALDELQLKTRRFAEIIFGVLVVEDLVAILILVALSSFAVQGVFDTLAILRAGTRLLLVAGTWILVGYFIIPRIVRKVGELGNEEMLTILSVGLCLALATLSVHFHYSPALGAFIMGSILAESAESKRIEELIVPLKNIFGAIFFVSVGMLINPTIVKNHIGSILLITSALFVGKTLHVALGALLSGNTVRSSVQVGMGMAQVGEFSFLFVALGANAGLTSDFLYPIVVTVSVITAFSTPYFLRYSNDVAQAIENRLPLSAKKILINYAAWVQEQRASRENRVRFSKGAIQWVASAILMSAIFTLTKTLAQPWIDSKIIEPISADVVAWIIALLAVLPFLWAMFSAFRQMSPPFLFFSRLLSVLILALLTREFFTPLITFALTILTVGIFLFLNHRSIEITYRWFENQFLLTFKEDRKTRRKTDLLRDLAPWDAHLVRLKVHPNSEFVGQPLEKIRLRERYGINVVMILRGLKDIIAPNGRESIFPKDEILLLGTDEQIEHIRQIVEKPPGLQDRYRDLSGYELKKFLVSNDSFLLGRTIRESGIRENFGGLIVGIERGGDRFINPHSNFKLDASDLLWIVGTAESLSRLNERRV